MCFRIIYDEYGQTCNRFWSYLDSLGWAITQNKKVVILFPEDGLKYYDNFRNCSFVSIPLWGKSQFIWKLARKIFVYNMLIQFFYKMRLSKKIGFYDGWSLRDDNIYYPGVKKDIEYIFKPNRDITYPIDQLFNSIKSPGHIIVGIHLRRGDYKSWFGGKYYFEDDVYSQYMQQIVHLYPEKNVSFYFSTNEKLHDSLFRKYDIIEKPLNSAPADLYALSQCDLIIGPPSTFSRWASFIGNVPLCIIYNANMVLTSKHFSPMVGCETFANGSKMVREWRGEVYNG